MITQTKPSGTQRRPSKQLDEAPQRAAAYASLAAYHQIKASADENAALSDALRKHAAAMEHFGPRAGSRGWCRHAVTRYDAGSQTTARRPRLAVTRCSSFSTATARFAVPAET